MLTEQYRMQQKISNIVSAVTYENKLVCSKNILENPYKFGPPILKVIPQLATSNVVFFNHSNEEMKVQPISLKTITNIIYSLFPFFVGRCQLQK